jgi:hypothetical protein
MSGLSFRGQHRSLFVPSVLAHPPVTSRRLPSDPPVALSPRSPCSSHLFPCPFLTVAVWSCISSIPFARGLFIAVMMEAVRISETLVYPNEATQRDVTEGCLCHTCRRDNLKIHVVDFYLNVQENLTTGTEG